MTESKHGLDNISGDWGENKGENSIRKMAIWMLWKWSGSKFSVLYCL